MWRPLMVELASTHTVIAPDLRGAGQSSTPADGYTKAEMAQDIQALARKLGYERIRIVGHDIGLMVAYAYAAQYPSEVDRVALMDAFLPGVGNWRDVWLMRDLWHFHFYGKTPLALVHGRERIYFEHFWNDFAADPAHSVPERDRRIYAKAYARPGGMRSGFEYFRAFEQDAKDLDRKSTRLNSSHLVISYAVFCLKKKKQPSESVPRASRRPAHHAAESQAHGQAAGRLPLLLEVPYTPLTGRPEVDRLELGVAHPC